MGSLLIIRLFFNKLCTDVTLLHITFTCGFKPEHLAFKPGRVMSCNWLPAPDCEVSSVHADGMESSQSIPGSKFTPQKDAQQHLTPSSAPAHPEPSPSQTPARQIKQHQAPVLAAEPVLLGLHPQGTDSHTATSAADVSHDADGHPLLQASDMLPNTSSSGDSHTNAETADALAMPFTAAHGEQSHHDPAPQPASRPAFALGLSPLSIKGDADPQQAVLQESPAVQTRRSSPGAFGTGSQTGVALPTPSAGTSTSSSVGTADRHLGSGVVHADWSGCGDAPKAHVSSSSNSSRGAVQSTREALTSSAVQSIKPAVPVADSSARVFADDYSSVAPDTRPARVNAEHSHSPAASAVPVGLPLPELGVIQAETADRLLPRMHSVAPASAARADVYAVSDALLLDKLSDVCNSSTGVQSASQTLPMEAASSKGSAQASCTTSQVSYWFHVFHASVIRS